MFTRNLRFLATLLFVCTELPLNTADSSCTTESLPSFMNLDTCLVIPEDLCTNPDMLMPFTESLISCGLAAIADLELPSKLYLVEGIVVNLLKNFGLGKITSAAFGVCKAMGGILDTLDNLSLGILGNVIEPVKKLMSLLPLPDCSANSIKGTVKCGSRISVKLPSSLNAKECFKHVRTTCSLTKANKGPALVDLFETIGCLSGKAFDATTPEGLTGLACSVLTGWAKSARVIGLNSLLPFPLPLPGLGGGSSSSSGDKDESKGLVSDVLDAVTDSLSLLKAHDSDSGSSGLISNVLDAVSDPLSILKPHDSDSGSGGLISNVLDAVTDPLSILKPTDSDSGGSGLISNVLEAVTDPLSILKPHDFDSENKGLISNALGAVTDPLSILKPQDDVSSDDKSHGLLSSVFDAVTPNNDDDGKSKGLFSGLIDAGIHPISDSGSTSSDDSHTSASDDKEKPKGLISGMLDAITSPLQSHDSDKKGDSDKDDSATEDKQPHGLLSNVFGLVQPKLQTQDQHFQMKSSPEQPQDAHLNQASFCDANDQNIPKIECWVKDDESNESTKPKGLVSGLLGGLLAPETATKTFQQDESGSQFTSSEQIVSTTKLPDVVVQSPQELALKRSASNESPKAKRLPSGFLGRLIPPATTMKTTHQEKSQFYSTPSEQIATTATKSPNVEVESLDQAEAELENSEKSAKPTGLFSGMIGRVLAPKTTKTSDKDESKVTTTATISPQVVVESPGEVEVESDDSKEPAKSKGVFSGLLGALLVPDPGLKTSHEDQSGSQSTPSEQTSTTTTKSSDLAVKAPEKAELESDSSKEPVKSKGLFFGLLGGLLAPDTATETSDQNNSVAQSASNTDISTTTTKQPGVEVKSANEPEVEPEDKSKKKTKPKSLLSGLLGGLLG